MDTRRRRIAAVLVPLTLLAACTTEETGTPTAAPPATPSFTPSFGAPSVPDSLDAAAFAADPCSSLTPAQQAEFGVDGGSERTVDTGPKCDYSGGAFVSVLYSDDKPGLTHLYGLNEDNVWSYWEPTEVGGRPAVAHMLAGRESCDVAVGLSDTSYVSVGVPADTGAEACAEAVDWAGRVLETIEAGQ